MELEFKKEAVSWLTPVVQQVRTQEQTQELKLSDGMPDIGRVLCAWGQGVLRGKEWRSDGFSVSGGMMVWVLYAPEDGSQARCISGWLPMQMQWDLPEGTPDGQIRAMCMTRFVDARSVSPRKIMVRGGMSMLAEAMVQGQGSTYTPSALPEDIQLLQNTYPVRMWSEAGEKTVQLDEELILPASCPAARKLICGTLHPEVTEHRVMNGKVVFRGNGNLRVLYASEEGQLFSWEFPLSFSQFEDLTGQYGPDAQGDFCPAVTDLDLSLDDEGHFRLKCGMVVQYALSDVQMLRIVEDAYSPRRELELQLMDLEVPAILDIVKQTVNAEQRISQDADLVVQGTFLPDYPRVRTMDGKVQLDLPGQFQALYRNPEGVMQSSTARWEGNVSMDMHPDCSILAVPGTAPQPQTELAGDGMTLRTQLPLTVRTETRQTIPMVTAIRPGELRKPEADRPSLILRRAGEESLWQIARESGSTVEAIRSATGLEGEPAPEQMLLVPVL